MRGALIGLTAIAWISAASAEDAVTSENGLGPYHFGIMATATMAAIRSGPESVSWTGTHAPSRSASTSTTK